MQAQRANNIPAVATTNTTGSSSLRAIGDALSTGGRATAVGDAGTNLAFACHICGCDGVEGCSG